MPDSRTFGIALIAIGVVLVAAIYFLDRRREKGIKKAKGPLLLLDLDKKKPSPLNEPSSPEAPSPETPPPETPFPVVPPLETPDNGAAVTPAAPAPAFEILQGRPRIMSDLLRALLILLSLATAAGLVLVLLPQPAVDGMAQRLRARHGVTQPEKIAFLYLGDELKDNDFQIRGVVRNITTAPIEQLDASIRFYAHDGSILETAVVRMNREIIAPEEVAQFELVYPNYKMDFGSYSVEFKLRRGALVPYKDMRKTRTEPD